jgi:hypothetical protein
MGSPRGAGQRAAAIARAVAVRRGRAGCVGAARRGRARWATGRHRRPAARARDRGLARTQPRRRQLPRAGVCDCPRSTARS